MSFDYFRSCEDPLDLEYRSERVSILEKEWGLKLVRPLILEYKIPDDQADRLFSSVRNYVNRCLRVPGSATMGFDMPVEKLDQFRNSRINVTPNGACVPKKEYQFLYNDALQNWFTVFKTMISKNERILKLVRVTPNIRIKFGKELEDNEDRGLNTQLPHSDAWVEGPWGFNVFAPLIGDCENNTLRYYGLPDGPLPHNFFSTVGSYTEKQQLISEFEEDKSFIPKAGHIYISDYAVIHKTWRSSDSQARVSIDTTLMAGDHEVHPDRKDEYLKMIPDLGNSHFFQVTLPEDIQRIKDKRTTYSHYTTGNIRFHALEKKL